MSLRILICVTLVFNTFTCSSVGFDVIPKLCKSIIALNEMSILEIKVIEAKEINVPQSISVDGLRIDLIGRSSITKRINSEYLHTATYNYSIIGEKVGAYTIPSINLTIDGQQHNTKPIDIEVVTTDIASKHIINSNLPNENSISKPELIPEVDQIKINNFETFKIKYYCNNFNPINKPLSSLVSIENFKKLNVAYISIFKIEKNYIIYDIKAINIGASDFEPDVRINGIKVNSKSIKIEVGNNKLVDDEYNIIGGPDQDTILKFLPNARQVVKTIKRGKILNNESYPNIPKNLTLYPIRFSEFLILKSDSSNEKEQINDPRFDSDQILNGRLIDDVQTKNEEYQLKNSVFYFYQDQFDDWKVIE